MVQVTDGDTVVIRGIEVGEIHQATGGRKARLIGIDTPEVFGTAECHGAEASAFTKHELENKQVLVDFDVDNVDQYGRALVYLWQADTRLFNGRLAAEGYAQQLTVPPNVLHADLFTALVREARDANLGLWGDACANWAAPPTAAPRVARTNAPAPVITATTQPDPTPEPQGPSCHPSYGPQCLDANAEDYDCAGGSGNGPKYVQGPVNVHGSDPYGLDSDHDGVGCES